ncbi:helix-turn-helix domain-containing protein [Mycobacterium sp. ITM-2016-00317]|uniref:sigma-54-dependent Fis family transcriptional regulator n=1 Tax=Mycobacterium sp. ITM-2016-00317 TaxID=2099694 RepID=UPI00287FE585|nr:helix-turn-helix domain-containing protein [Mycobacterium sp. ITM-2016-00317]WNG87520.1 helix-turn-helix domain-containing protein [Mycobacterium sp. ITM-2016-00317]
MQSGAYPGGEPARIPTTPLAKARLVELRERFVSDPHNTDLSQLRPVIERSWRRSLACRISPGTTVFDAVAEPHLDEQLLRSADPVLTELERMCLDTGGSIALADASGTMALTRGEPSVVRWLERVFPLVGARMSEDVTGTNSDGTALEEGHAVQVWTAEHFTEALQDSCCTSVPIKDPLRGSVRGVLSMSLPEHIALQSDPRSIMLIVQGAAAEITRQLAERLAAREQALLTAYLSEVRKRGTDAVVAMDERTIIVSRRATQLLDGGDYSVLAGYARESERRGSAAEHELAVGPERVLRLEVRPLDDSGKPIGAVLRLHNVSAPARGTRRIRANTRRDAFDALVGDSLSLRRAVEAASTVCAKGMPAYVIGEEGTGKRLLAETMATQMADRTLFVDCGVTQSQHQIADLAQALVGGAAAVLHHVDRLDAQRRAVLADVLDAAEAPRVVLTARSLTDETLPVIAALCGIEIAMPPLRARREDITALVDHFLGAVTPGPRKASARLLEALASADFPGNVRQLRDIVETAARHSPFGEVSMDHLTTVHRRMLARSPLSRLEEAELQQIREALAEAGGNRVRAAAILQIGRSTLYRRMNDFTRRGFEVGCHDEE